MVGMRWVTMIMAMMITMMMTIMMAMMMINSQVDGICFDVLDLMNTTQRRWGSEHYGWVRKMQGKYVQMIFLQLEMKHSQIQIQGACARSRGKYKYQFIQ